MIGALRGLVLERSSAGEVLLDVQGVCYRVQVTPNTLASVVDGGAPVLLHTHLHVREDALTLFGFASRDERACFEVLIGAHGVGPAMAMAILAVHRPEALREVVASDDADALCLVPGIGKKTAVRLLLELKSRLDMPVLDPVPAMAGTPRAEVRDALAALGYGPEEIHEATRELPTDGDVQLMLRLALARVAPAGGRERVVH
ncbi:MAG TPA: Holliday junction branch migration protein RuvA [Acidimicrobiales bacterium]|nr:Holliday junction branch migration protein RuvA [Acidimicrobiales bacterium]